MHDLETQTRPEIGLALQAEEADAVDQFLAAAAEELEPYYLSDETVKRVEAAGCHIYGARYFRGLFEYGGPSSSSVRLKSLFIGAVAYDKPSLAVQARDIWLGASENVTLSKAILIDSLNDAIRQERHNKNWARLERLSQAAKELGNPLSKRLLGSLATHAAMAFDKL